MDKITVVIPAQNNESTIGKCLESALWADEVILVDSFSTDKTANIARELGVRVLQNKYEYSSQQYNWGIEKAGNPWVFVLDSDETITPELRDEIKTVLSSKTDCVAFKMRRRNSFMGREMRGCGWDDDWNQRLFRKDRGWVKDDVVHAKFMADGKVGRLKGKLTHDSFTTLDAFFLKMKRFATWSADKMEKKGVRVRWHHLSLRPAFRFFKMYILQYGFTQGIRGFILSMLGMMSVFMKYAKLWERQHKK